MEGLPRHPFCRGVPMPWGLGCEERGGSRPDMICERLRINAKGKRLMAPDAQFEGSRMTGEKRAGRGLCIECALRRHDFHELAWRHTGREGHHETPLPHALIDGRRYVLLSYAWTHVEQCGECKRKAANLYLPIPEGTDLVQ